MSNRAIFIIVLLVATIVGYVGYTVLDAEYLTPRRKLVSALATYHGNLDLVQSERAKMPAQHAQLKSWVDRTLGPDLETVRHELRIRLNRVGEDLGLTAISVDTGEAGARLSPANSEFPGKVGQALRDEIDFAEITGTIAGEGTYEQVIGLVAALQAEPWIKEIFSVHFTPIEAGSRFRVNVRLRTLFFPGRSPSDPLPDDLPSIDQTQFAVLTSVNPFALPAPPPVVQPTEPVRVAADTHPPAFPYDKWVMTGVVGVSGNKEVWLVETGTGETKLLTPGEQLSDMKLVDAEGDVAEFEYNGKSVHLQVGQSLGEGVGRND